VDPTNAVPVVGQPLAYGIGFGVLLLIVFGGSWTSSLVTVAHEGGHMIVGALMFRGPKGFTLTDGGGGATPLTKYDWSVGDLLMRFAGYPLPPLAGLGGAYLVRAGNTAGVLWIALILLLAAFFQAKNPLANVVTLAALLATGWAVYNGQAELKAAVAVGLVWWMLIGGAAYSTFWLSRADKSDAQVLASRTLVPRIVWHAVWAVIGVVCLWFGARAILAF
jgi:Peptidase M50B-like